MVVGEREGVDRVVLGAGTIAVERNCRSQTSALRLTSNIRKSDLMHVHVARAQCE